MALESATFISGLNAANPVGASDLRSQGDDHLRLLKSVLQATFPNASRALRFPAVASEKSSNYTVLATDDQALIPVDASSGVVTVGLPSSGTISAGFVVRVMKTDSSTNVVTVDGDGADTINGTTTRTLHQQYQSESYIWNGTVWRVLSIGAVGKLFGQLDVNGFALGDGTRELLDFLETASAVNHLRITNAATGNAPQLAAVGDDSNIALKVLSKGSANIDFLAGAVELLRLAFVASSVNFPQLEPAAAGSPVKLAAKGDDDNVGIDFDTKGSGGLLFNGTAIPFLKSFTSAEQTITLGGQLTIPHSLGAIPELVQARLINKTTEAGYAVDDEVIFPEHMNATPSSSNRGLSTVVDAANIVLRFGSSALALLNKSTGVGTTITAANWRLIVRAWV